MLTPDGFVALMLPLVGNKTSVLALREEGQSTRLVCEGQELVLAWLYQSSDGSEENAQMCEIGIIGLPSFNVNLSDIYDVEIKKQIVSIRFGVGPGEESAILMFRR